MEVVEEEDGTVDLQWPARQSRPCMPEIAPAQCALVLQPGFEVKDSGTKAYLEARDDKIIKSGERIILMRDLSEEVRKYRPNACLMPSTVWILIMSGAKNRPRRNIWRKRRDASVSQRRTRNGKKSQEGWRRLSNRTIRCFVMAALFASITHDVAVACLRARTRHVCLVQRAARRHSQRVTKAACLLPSCPCCCSILKLL